MQVASKTATCDIISYRDAVESQIFRDENSMKHLPGDAMITSGLCPFSFCFLIIIMTSTIWLSLQWTEVTEPLRKNILCLSSVV